ncbi:MAG: hypothetical protein HW396_401 [Candidatus Dadabacteria bacterium]|jgi:hypothetical protein|nr:hypothetical protein [Candidatus Dadabacteria bacterium]
MSETCVRTTLSTFPYGNIQKCSCGGYYVTFGYVTLRLSHEELKSFTEMLNNVIGGGVRVNPQDITNGGYR